MLDGIIVGAAVSLLSFLSGFMASEWVQRQHDNERREWGKAYGALQQKLAEAERVMMAEEER
jgi:hypothetical protein